MKLLIAGGGTGGHLFSGLAVAEAWKGRGGEVVFVGTQRGLEKELVGKFGYPLRMIQTSILKGSGGIQKFKTLFSLPRSFWESWKILKEEKPDRVLGIGGYASGPTVLMARAAGMPTSVLDQNSIPGMTNRILGKVVDQVFLTFDESARCFKKKKVRIFGNPVLRKMREGARSFSVKRRWSLMVCGGSQGAHRINEIFFQSLEKIRSEIPELFVVWQTGSKDFGQIQKKMGGKTFSGIIAPFFDDMEKKYTEVELVIGRSGAGTVTELALFGVPSILIPYPFAADGHQQENARVLEKAGGAFVMDESQCDGVVLAEKIISLLRDKKGLDAMSLAVRKLARPDAAERIVDELMK